MTLVDALGLTYTQAHQLTLKGYLDATDWALYQFYWRNGAPRFSDVARAYELHPPRPPGWTHPARPRLEALVGEYRRAQSAADRAQGRMEVAFMRHLRPLLEAGNLALAAEVAREMPLDSQAYRRAMQAIAGRRYALAQKDLAVFPKVI